jgi:type I restriction enzyme, S subunit
VSAIDQIRPGYQQTEVGVIPEDWDTELLDSLGKVVRGGSPRPAGDRRYFNGNFIPWLTVAALTTVSDTHLRVSETVAHLTQEGSKRSRTLPAGTVIIANSGATLGIAKILGVTCCANDGIAAIIDQRKGDKEFVCYYINTLTHRLREVVATGNGQPNLNTGLIRAISIPFPLEAEQRAIAAALGDADALIVSLDALIAKKRDLKQAAMQQLLTGRSRLPGFTGDWDVKRLGDVAKIRNEKINTFGSGQAEFCVELEQIGQNTGRIDSFTDARDRSSSKYHFRKGDILFGRLRPYLRKFWHAERDGVCSTEIWPLIPISDRLTSSFLFQTVQTDAFIDAANTAYGTHMPRADWNVLSRLKINVPNDRAEQSAIGAVLSDMATDIDALEHRRDKARALKQGMMQELLTGRIRLA